MAIKNLLEIEKKKAQISKKENLEKTTLEVMEKREKEEIKNNISFILFKKRGLKSPLF